MPLTAALVHEPQKLGKKVMFLLFKSVMFFLGGVICRTMLRVKVRFDLQGKKVLCVSEDSCVMLVAQSEVHSLAGKPVPCRSLQGG